MTGWSLLILWPDYRKHTVCQNVRISYELIITIGALIEIEAGVMEILLAPQEIVTPDKPLIDMLPTSA